MPDSDAAPTSQSVTPRIVIKKYVNRRLYNTQSSSYVTLEHLAEMVRRHVDFIVVDARTGDDITRQVLTQIIFEAENRGQNLLPIQFLRQLIGLYGGQMQAMTPGYLEASLDAFVQQGERLREQWVEALAPATAARPPLSQLEEQVRSNMALFDRAMKMFTPFAYRTVDSPAASAEAAAPAPDRQTELADLRARMAAMQQQIERLLARDD